MGCCGYCRYCTNKNEMLINQLDYLNETNQNEYKPENKDFLNLNNQKQTN